MRLAYYLFSIVLLGIILLPHSALAWDNYFDGSLLPNDPSLGDEAWDVPTTWNDISMCTTDGDVLNIIDGSSSTTAYFFKSTIPQGDPVTIEARMRVANGSGVVLAAGTPSGGTWVWLSLNQIVVSFGSGSTLFYDADMGQFRTIRIANDQIGNSSVWLDSILIANGNALTNNGGSLRFGAGLIPDVSSSYWDYVAYSKEFLPIPEPSSLAALGLGLMPIVWRLRRRRG